MFPIRGSFHGPGGSFGGEVLALDFFPNLDTMKMERRRKKKKA